MLLRRAYKNERFFLALLVVSGLALRVAWLSRVGGSITGTYGSAEGSRVALAVAQGRGIADAYYQGYGPTAHMMPAAPAIAGFLLWLFGPQTTASNLALLCWCLAQVTVGILLLRSLFRSLGANSVVTKWGTGLLCLVTPFITQETIDFRYWDGAAALCLAAANLLLVSRLEQEQQLDGRDFALISALAAVTLFVSPPVGLSTGLCWSVFAIRRLDLRRCMKLALLTGGAIVLVFAPWTIRNQRALGAPVLMRSNFGLELAIANHPEALSNSPPELVHARRLEQIHPYQSSSKPPFVVKPGGEVAYSRALAKQTRDWIMANPRSFAVLCLRHLREFFFPDPWELYFSGWSDMAAARAAVMSLVDLLGLIGLGFAFYRRQRGYWSIAVFVGALSVPYALFEPTTSHMYPAYGVLAFLAVDVVTNAASVVYRQLARAAVEPRLGALG